MNYISEIMLRIELQMQTRQMISYYRNTFHQKLVLSFELASLDVPNFRKQEILVLGCLLFDW